MASLNSNKFIYLGMVLFLTACAGDEPGNKSIANVTNTESTTPTVSLSSDSYSINADESITLYWTTSDVTSCTATGGDWAGDKPLEGSETIGPFEQDMTLTITCSGDNGTVSGSVDIQVSKPGNTPPPAISLTASSEQVSYQGSTTLSWSASNADSCSAAGSWSGSQATSGTVTLDSLTETGTYTLACSGAGGISSESLTINVSAAPQPEISISASPAIVTLNGSTTISWNSTNASSCSASGAWSGALGVNGSRVIDGIQQNASYVINCSGVGGSGTASVDVSVLPTVTFSASQNTVSTNGSTTLSWTSSNATSCSASGDWSGTKATSGSQTINSIISDSVFNLSCSGAGGTASYSLDIQVLVSNNGTALISWTPPTENTDNSPLNDLTGYKIYYGTSPGDYTNTINIDNPGLTSYLVEDLAANTTWYFVMTAFNANNIESAYSEEKSKTIN